MTLNNTMEKEKEGELLKSIFGKKRIVALAGNKNCGKSNNLVALIEDFRKINKNTKIYVYGLDSETLNYLKKFENIFEITELSQFTGKRDSLFIIDEFQRLHLGDRRYKDLLDSFVDLIYHKEKNNRVLFCSPNLREFNSVIGGKIEKWLVKSISFDCLVNGSQLKQAVINYSGRYKQLNDLVIPKDTILILGEDTTRDIKLPYIKEADGKADILDIFSEDVEEEPKDKVEEKLSRNCQEKLSENCQENCQKEEDDLEKIYKEIGE